MFCWKLTFHSIAEMGFVILLSFIIYCSKLRNEFVEVFAFWKTLQENCLEDKSETRKGATLFLFFKFQKSVALSSIPWAPDFEKTCSLASQQHWRREKKKTHHQKKKSCKKSKNRKSNDLPFFPKQQGKRRDSEKETSKQTKGNIYRGAVARTCCYKTYLKMASSNQFAFHRSGKVADFSE